MCSTQSTLNFIHQLAGQQGPAIIDTPQVEFNPLFVTGKRQKLGIIGCDVISEKPMTIDEEKCQAIINAIARTGRKLRVTFNYRYAPHHSKIRFAESYLVPLTYQAGGHGGGDRVMLNDLFGTPDPDPLQRAADYRDGARSILTGIAANCSIRLEQPVKIKDLAVLLPD